MYEIKGHFNTGDEWSEYAENRQELEKVLEKVYQNETAIPEKVVKSVYDWSTKQYAEKELYDFETEEIDTEAPQYFHELFPDRNTELER